MQAPHLAEERMDDKRKIELPGNLGESLDPIEGVPYPPDHPAHKVWVEATRRAEQEVLRINADAHASLSADNASEWMQNTAVAKFDVWAKRGVHVVWSDEAVTHYDAWLVSYANGWIDSVSSLLTSRKPPFAPEVLLADLRHRLAVRVNYWKAEARRYRSQQEAQVAAAMQAETHPRPSAAVIQRRKSALRKYRDAHRLNAEGAARKIGISDTAIRAIVREDWTRFNSGTQQRLLEAIGLPLEEWYRE